MGSSYLVASFSYPGSFQVGAHGLPGCALPSPSPGGTLTWLLVILSFHADPRGPCGHSGALERTAGHLFSLCSVPALGEALS